MTPPPLTKAETIAAAILCHDHTAIANRVADLRTFAIKQPATVSPSAKRYRVHAVRSKSLSLVQAASAIIVPDGVVPASLEFGAAAIIARKFEREVRAA